MIANGLNNEPSPAAKSPVASSGTPRIRLPATMPRKKPATIEPPEKARTQRSVVGTRA